jgi:hypothetical protein
MFCVEMPSLRRILMRFTIVCISGAAATPAAWSNLTTGDTHLGIRALF